MRFREKLARFFINRYGVDNGADKLNFFLVICSVILTVVCIFIRGIVATAVIRIISFLLIGFCIFRMVSKNIPQRRKENAAYLKISSSVKQFLTRQYNRIKYIKTHRYRKCPSCKRFLRLKYVPGKHTVKCPGCQNSFNVKF